MNGIVRVRAGPVRFHTDCKLFDAKASKCTRRGCIVQQQELACKFLELRFEENHERFKCAHCNTMGKELDTAWVRTEFFKDGTPADVYKCRKCDQLTVLYQTDKAQRCRKLTDINFG